MRKTIKIIFVNNIFLFRHCQFIVIEWGFSIKNNLTKKIVLFLLDLAITLHLDMYINSTPIYCVCKQSSKFEMQLRL